MDDSAARKNNQSIDRLLELLQLELEYEQFQENENHWKNAGLVGSAMDTDPLEKELQAIATYLKAQNAIIAHQQALIDLLQGSDQRRSMLHILSF